VRILLDEHISDRVATALQDKGHDALAVVGSDPEGEDDDVLWDFAISTRRVVVTYDAGDFTRVLGELIRDGRSHPGLVLVSTQTIHTRDFGALVAAIDRLVTSDRNLTDAVIYLPRA